MGIAAILAVFKIVRLLTRARDEPAYLLHGDDDDALLNELRPESDDELPVLTEDSETRSPRQFIAKETLNADEVTSRSGGRRLAVGCLIAMICLSGLGVASVGALVWFFGNLARHRYRIVPAFPIRGPWRNRFRIGPRFPILGRCVRAGGRDFPIPIKTAAPRPRE